LKYKPPTRFQPGFFRRSAKHERVANEGETDYRARCWECGSKQHPVRDCAAADPVKKKWQEEGVPAT